MILLDTNLLTRMTRLHEPQSGIARAAIQTLLRRRERLIVVPQGLYEFWAVPLVRLVHPLLVETVWG